MDLSNNIRKLRGAAGLTQEQLAEILGVSPQSVSKWENQASMPDISLLPGIAEAFGVSIDELFGLTREQKLMRIDRRMDLESELPGELFMDYAEFLKAELDKTGQGEKEERRRLLSLLGHLYHHRMLSDAQKVSRYAREAIELAPEKKDCQWLLDEAEGQAIWDWNVSNHSKLIDFYKHVIEIEDVEPRTPLPYYYLLDQLIADRRTDEAEEYLARYERLPAHKPFMARVYRAHIALARFDEAEADRLMEQVLAEFPGNGGMLFEAAQYYAKKADYGRAIECYEASYAAEECNKPRFYDALQGIATIQEIRGDYEKAAQTWDRILENLRVEWGYDEESCVREAEAEKARLLKRAGK